METASSSTSLTFHSSLQCCQDLDMGWALFSIWNGNSTEGSQKLLGSGEAILMQSYHFLIFPFLGLQFTPVPVHHSSMTTVWWLNQILQRILQLKGWVWKKGFPRLPYNLNRWWSRGSLLHTAAVSGTGKRLGWMRRPFKYRTSKFHTHKGYLPVQNGPIGDLFLVCWAVTTKYLSLHNTSEWTKILKHLKHLIRVMRRHDLTNK